jgi:hypothetical protein
MVRCSRWLLPAGMTLELTEILRELFFIKIGK